MLDERSIELPRRSEDTIVERIDIKEQLKRLKLKSMKGQSIDSL
jgi:hypothetical protein